jgi:isoleucyl-tRNA synthetase
MIPAPTQGAGSVHQAEFAEADSLASAISKEAAEQWSRLAQVRSAVLVALEQARAAKAIGKALEAKVKLHAGGEAAGLQKLLQERRGVLPALFIVSQVEIEPAAPDGAAQSELLPGLDIKIERADGAKCERCWNYSIHVGENPRYPTVCERCTAALAEIESAV